MLLNNCSVVLKSLAISMEWSS